MRALKPIVGVCSGGGRGGGEGVDVEVMCGKNGCQDREW